VTLNCGESAGSRLAHSGMPVSTCNVGERTSGVRRCDPFESVSRRAHHPMARAAQCLNQSRNGRWRSDASDRFDSERLFLPVWKRGGSERRDDGVHLASKLTQDRVAVELWYAELAERLHELRVIDDAGQVDGDEAAVDVRLVKLPRGFLDGAHVRSGIRRIEYLALDPPRHVPDPATNVRIVIARDGDAVRGH